MKSTVLFVKIGDDREVRCEFTTRFHNMIPSDPRIIERPPTLPEILTAAAKIIPGGRSDYHTTSQIED